MMRWTTWARHRTTQDIVRQKFETGGEHPLVEAPASDAETKATIVATQEVEKTFEGLVRTLGATRGLTPAQVQAIIQRVKNPPR